MLKGTLPFQAVGLYASPMLFKGHQMCYFVDEGNQESVFVERSIHRNLVQSVGHSTVIPMPGNPMVYNL